MRMKQKQQLTSQQESEISTLKFLWNLKEELNMCIQAQGKVGKIFYDYKIFNIFNISML